MEEGRGVDPHGPQGPPPAFEASCTAGYVPSRLGTAGLSKASRAWPPAHPRGGCEIRTREGTESQPAFRAGAIGQLGEPSIDRASTARPLGAQPGGGGIEPPGSGPAEQRGRDSNSRGHEVPTALAVPRHRPARRPLLVTTVRPGLSPGSLRDGWSGQTNSRTRSEPR